MNTSQTVKGIVSVIPDGLVKPSGTLNVTKVGSYNVKYYESANFNVFTEEKVVTPSKNIQTLYPYTDRYISKVIVNAIPSSYIIPSGTMEITKNGTYNVSSYSNVSVEVESSGGPSNTCTVTLTADSATYGITLYSAETLVDGEIVTKVGTSSSIPAIPGGSTLTINNVLRGSIVCLQVGTAYPDIKIHDGDGYESLDNDYGKLLGYYQNTFLVQTPTLGGFNCHILAYDND